MNFFDYNVEEVDTLEYEVAICFTQNDPWRIIAIDGEDVINHIADTFVISNDEAEWKFANETDKYIVEFIKDNNLAKPKMPFQNLIADVQKARLAILSAAMAFRLSENRTDLRNNIIMLHKAEANHDKALEDLMNYPKGA